jgi:hypothetical protein
MDNLFALVIGAVIVFMICKNDRNIETYDNFHSSRLTPLVGIYPGGCDVYPNRRSPSVSGEHGYTRSYSCSNSKIPEQQCNDYDQRVKLYRK